MSVFPFYTPHQRAAWMHENCVMCRLGWPSPTREICPIEEALTLSYFGGGWVCADIAQRMTINDRVYTWRCGEFVARSGASRTG